MPSRRSTGRSWTPETTAKLFNMTFEGHTQAEIAKHLRRTTKAVKCKMAKLRRKAAKLPFKSFALLTDDPGFTVWLLDRD